MPDRNSRPLIRRADDVEYETVDAAEGMRKGVLVGSEHGAPNFALRRFVLEPGANVPKHTNDVEHEQYVLEGEYVVGIGETSDASPVADTDGDSVDGQEYTVRGGDSILIPAGTVHWYRNESDQPGTFICAVPADDDEIRLVEE